MATTTGVTMTFTNTDTATKFNKSLSGMIATAITVDNTPAFVKGYARIVNGTLTSAKHTVTTDVDLTE